MILSNLHIRHDRECRGDRGSRSSSPAASHLAQVGRTPEQYNTLETILNMSAAEEKPDPIFVPSSIGALHMAV
jgi:hypothetical protein